MSAIGGSAALAGGFPTWLSGALADAEPHERFPLRFAPEATPRGLRLDATVCSADVGGGLEAPAWLINDSLPSPLLRVRRSELFDVTLTNGIPDPLILHWHGLTPPEASDGHPRFAVGTGGTYHYQFTVNDRAGTYWYHSHSHHKVGKHTQMGIAGMIIVEDDEEAALGLPSGDREIPLILQDRRVDAAGRPVYSDPNLQEGHTGSEPFGNGVRRPFLEIDSALYRFRLLNGSNARIFRLELGDGRPFVLIGNDGGLLERPASIATLDLAPGERADVLVDFSNARVGQRIMLRSLGVQIGGRMSDMGAISPHALGMDLLELRVAREVVENVRIPERLAVVPGPDPRDSVRERTFQLSMVGNDHDTFRLPMVGDDHEMSMHQINHKQFEMDRVDEQVPFGQTEIWAFVNDDWFPHPIHLHATHFRVLSRTGGRGEVMPWEQGLKDTVLIHPRETVKVAVCFDAHRGLFPLHCHNLEHEDMGMMLNLQVE